MQILDNNCKYIIITPKKIGTFRAGSFALPLIKG